MTKAVCLLGAGLLAFASTCAAGNEPPAEPEVDITTRVEGNNRFALDLYARLRTAEGNVFFSPYSVSTALAMTSVGARGITREKMASVLYLQREPEAVHAAFGALAARLDRGASGGGYRLHQANRLWGQRGFGFLTDFLDVCRRRYGAELGELDFAQAPESSRRVVNEWVADKTEGRIEDLLPPGSVDADTRLVLTNAIYFKGDWAEPFDEEATEDAPFFLADGGETEAPLMRREGRFPFAEVDGLKVLELPYAREELAMLVVLPAEADGLAEVEIGLDLETLDGWVAALRQQQVRVHLPRFTVRQRVGLARTLSDMGMASAFRPPSPDDPRSADFSGMTGRRDLRIDEVFHQAFVAVDEQGTEAAAATGVTMKLTSAIVTQTVFRADHPFLFLIRDRATGSVLFLGRLADPR